jgi:hypothetical protein
MQLSKQGIEFRAQIHLTVTPAVCLGSRWRFRIETAESSEFDRG